MRKSCFFQSCRVGVTWWLVLELLKVKCGKDVGQAVPDVGVVVVLGFAGTSPAYGVRTVSAGRPLPYPPPH